MFSVEFSIKQILKYDSKNTAVILMLDMKILQFEQPNWKSLQF